MKTIQSLTTAPAAFAAAALAMALCTFSPSQPLAAQSQREEIASVDFVGNEAFSDSELRRAVFTRASSCPFILAVTTCALGIDWGRDRSYYSPRALGDDVEGLTTLYRAHGFRAIDIRPEVEQRGDGSVAITFQIDEGIPFRVGSIQTAGDSLPPALDLEGAFPIDVGDPLSFLLLQETTDSLTLRLRNQGYASAEVYHGFFRARGRRPRSPTRGTRAPTPSDDSGDGQQTARGSVILDRLFRGGRTLSREPDSQTQGACTTRHVARCRRAGGTGPYESDSIMPIVVEVVEGDARRVRTDLGGNSAECFNFEGRWTSRNFFGGGRSLQARARVSNLLASTLQSTFLCAQAGEGEYGRVNWIAGIDFNQPSLLSPRMNLLVGIFAERQRSGTSSCAGGSAWMSASAARWAPIPS